MPCTIRCQKNSTSSVAGIFYCSGERELWTLAKNPISIGKIFATMLIHADEKFFYRFLDAELSKSIA